MRRREFIGLSAAGAVAGALGVAHTDLNAQGGMIEDGRGASDRSLNPNTKWLRAAKWGLFTHYLAHRPSSPVPEGMTAKLWNQKVNSFQVEKLCDQLVELKAPYFFITIGQKGGYFCSPNRSYERLFGSSDGKLSARDLVADLAAGLVARGIRMCVYLPALGRRDSSDTQEMWRQVIAEWSGRWGTAISAWWIDGGVFSTPAIYRAYTNAFKAGNRNALIAYNTGPLGMSPDPKLPATEYEDYLAGECNWHLPVSGTRPWDGKQYYMTANIAGDQLHFLNFLGDFWGVGEPRFPDELVIGWTKHTNKHGGTITWDLPLSDTGGITKNYFNQVNALSESLGKNDYGS